jgi:cytochrome b
MPQYIAVWDPLIRIGHWTIVLAFAAAYMSGEDLLTVHVWAGYIVGAVVLIRVSWGFIGPSRARFTDFVYAPGAVLAYLGNLLRSRAVHYIGHSPAGGAMVVALLAMLVATVVTGVMTLGAEKQTGPLASLYAAALVAGPFSREGASDRPITTGNRETGGQGTEREEGVLRELHETFGKFDPDPWLSLGWCRVGKFCSSRESGFSDDHQAEAWRNRIINLWALTSPKPVLGNGPSQD